MPPIKPPAFFKSQEDAVRASLLGCRAFYFAMYALFYLAVCLYPNKLTESPLYTFAWYLPISIAAIAFFLTAGSNPGTLEPKASADIELGTVGQKAGYNEVATSESIENLPTVELPSQRFCEPCQ